MVMGGKVGGKSNSRNRVRSKDKGSDDSDDDYVVSDEENEDDFEYCSSLDECASEEIFLDSFVEEEDEEKEKEVGEVGWRTLGRSSFAEEDTSNKSSRRRRREEDEDYEGEEEVEEEEEFILDEDYCSDEEEPTLTRKKNTKASKRMLLKRGPQGGQENKKKYASKEPKRRLKKKTRVGCDDDYNDDSGDDSRSSIPSVRKSSKTGPTHRKRKFHVSSDSDHASPGSSDHEYTISEEEREQMIEAQKLCGNVKPALRNSSSLEKIEDGDDLGQCKKRTIRKGKEKIEELKIEVAKQVCGICLSEEDKRRVRGTLDSCSHYFCFACILEWSKVESRCPLCKKRFKAITKPARSAAGVDLREVVIQVPEHDQVYQPSEEELRSFIDPYEHVICSVCLHGGDDGLMLLCDICDSSGHTYCVGLGREVPDGNWYCDGCRPAAKVSLSSTSQAQDSLSEQRTISNNLHNRPSPVMIFGESVEPAFTSSPQAPFAQVPASPLLFGAGASTISGRRWIHRHIQDLLSRNRINLMAARGNGMAPANTSNDFLNSQVHQVRDELVQQSQIQDNRTLYAIVEESSRGRPNPLSSLQSRNLFSQVAQGPSTATMNASYNLALWPQHAGINPISSNLAFCGSHCSDFSTAKEQLQLMVRTHLQNLSRDIDLGNSFRDIASQSTQTILAACGLEHIRSDVHFVPQPSFCPHVERLVAGERSLLKGCCFVCFDSFVKDTVKRILDASLPRWLSLGL